MGMRTITFDPAGQPEHDPRIPAELNVGERLVWAGRPVPGLVARKALPVALFGLAFLGFSLFWAGSAVSMGSSASGGPPLMNLVFPLFGLPFILVGVWMLMTPLRSRRAARKTLYALTDRRAIVWEPRWRSDRVASFGPEALAELRRNQRSDGSGDLIFRRRPMRSDSDVPIHRMHEGFLGVAAVGELEKLVRETLERAGR
jgi:hypothetical protein